MRAVCCRGRLVDFRGNSGLVCQIDRLKDTRQLEPEGLRKRQMKLHSKKKLKRILKATAYL